MPDINNSLATQIQAPQIDIGGTLGKAIAIQRQQQEFEHKKFLYEQGGGFDPAEQLTRANTANVQAETYGRVGGILSNYKNQSDLDFAHSLAKGANLPGADLIRAQLDRKNPDEIRQFGRNVLQQYGQPSQASIEQSGVPAGNKSRETGRYEPFPVPPGEPIISRTEAATGGRKTVKSSPAIVGDDEAVRNGLYSPTPEQKKRGVTGPVNPVPGPGVVVNKDGSISSNVTQETLGTQKSLAEDYAGYKDSAKNAAMTKYLLHNMSDDADRLSTGKGATFTNNLKQWLQSAQTLPGAGKVIKDITGDISDPIAAFEALQKNAGQLTRATLKDVEGKAASEYRLIQQQLPNAEMSPRGLKLVTAQLMAPEDFKQSKLQAADRWKASNSGSLGGFEADWNKNISPAAFLFARLPSSDRDALIKNMKKTDTGQAQLQNIRKQAEWAHKNGLDEFLN